MPNGLTDERCSISKNYLVSTPFVESIMWTLAFVAALCGALFPACHGRSAFVFGGMDGSEYTDRSGPRVIPRHMGDAGGLECKWYNYNCFKGTDNKCTRDPNHPDCRCNEVKHYCEQPEEGKRSHCYMSWTNVTGTPELIKAGCWLNDLSCWNKNECVSTKTPSTEVHFCCCEGNMCNQDFQPPVHVPETPAPATVESTPVPPPSTHATIGYALIIPVVGLVFIAIAYGIYRRQKSLDSRHQPVPTVGDDGDEEDRSPGGTPHLGRLRPIQLLEIKVRAFMSDAPHPVMF